MIIDLSDHDKRVLATIGRGPYGTEFIKIFKKARDQAASLDGIDRSKDYNDQVEGRLLFKDFSDEMLGHLNRNIRQKNRAEPEDFE